MFFLKSKNSFTGNHISKLQRFLSSKATSKSVKDKMADIPSLKQFLTTQKANTDLLNQEISNFPENIQVQNLEQLNLPYTGLLDKKFYVDTYGCQMNFADTEIINSILINSGMQLSPDKNSADIIFLNTCSIRENAEAKIWHNLSVLRAEKINKKKNFLVGVLGCMAERLKDKLVHDNKVVD